MARTPNNFSANNQLSSAPKNLSGTVASASQVVIGKLSFKNTNATVSRLVTVYIVESGGSAGSTNDAVEKSIPPRKTWDVITVRGEVLTAGMTLQAKQDSGTDVNSNMSGTTVT